MHPETALLDFEGHTDPLLFLAQVFGESSDIRKETRFRRLSGLHAR
jgi:hypothetical protein